MYYQSKDLQQFNNHVGLKFQLYNSLFTSLPFHRIEKTGILLSLLVNHCEEGFKKNQSPVEIIDEFFTRYVPLKNDKEKTDVLFRFVQYAERQVVLFDALEDSAFSKIHDMSGRGTMKHLASEVQKENAEEKLTEKLKDFAIRFVLTAHPTQFYPGSVLGIINDLSSALDGDNIARVNMYLRQLGRTAFYKKQKPTPYDEAVSLVWYLENIFYAAAGQIIFSLKEQFPHALSPNNPVITMGFWPGGDRDGNPNVTTAITLKVADALRTAIIRSYYRDVRRLKRRLTFKGVDTIIAELEGKLYKNIFVEKQSVNLSTSEILDTLANIRDLIIYEHNGLFVELVNNLISKVEVFGLHFASLDIRQESSVHDKVLQAVRDKEQLLPENYSSLSERDKINVLTNLQASVNLSLYEDELVKDTLQSAVAVKTIQQYNGEYGCNRYIISQCNSALNVIEVYALFLLNGWKRDELSVDIVPLFETIDDLKNAPEIMTTLYENEVYRQHLLRRNKTQTIMVGFSDGTKDGGYLMANWSIYKAKEELTKISEDHNIDVVFFDGRGGPPARGGGKTHQFYASMGKNISNKEIQLTIQGQTISSNFGTVDSAKYNIEQLLNAGIANELFATKDKTLAAEDEAILQELSNESFTAYKALKNHPSFLTYLAYVSPLNFYGETNIGSRPTRRGSSRLTLKDLRAIPFVGAWSQLKQNVTGYYGVGTALQAAEKNGQLPALKKLYQNSLFFKTLIDNCEMAMKKCFFPLTAYLSSHPQFGDIWKMIYEEYLLTEKYLFRLTGHNVLMAEYPVESLSIQMRERIVLPLTTIQQYAIGRIREMEAKMSNDPSKETFERLVVRTSFGIINAGRNSA
jgi:phosphoenolpyruvate carboxylase